MVVCDADNLTSKGRSDSEAIHCGRVSLVTRHWAAKKAGIAPGFWQVVLNSGLLLLFRL
jgi:hypothetical protein